MRRGQHSFTILFIMVVLVVVLLMTFGIIKVVRNHFDTAQEDFPCAAQVIAQNAVVEKTGELSAPTVSCPTKRVTIDPATDAVARKKTVADQMARCWSIWGQGELQLFGTAEGRYCHVCSMITVTDQKPIDGIGAYLDGTSYKANRTYAQFLTGTTKGTYFDSSKLPSGTQDTLAANTPIGVIFYYEKGNEWYNNLKNALLNNPVADAQAGGTVGFLATGVFFSSIGLAPLGILLQPVGAVSGAALGAIASMQTRSKNSYVAVVVARPLTEDAIKQLGCQYAPVAN